MKKALFLSTALGAAMLLGGAPDAFGQSGTSSSSVAPLPRQQQAERSIEGGPVDREVPNLLRQSEQAVASGSWTRANEYLERAQTTMLNAHAGSGGQGTIGLRSFEEAKQAIMNRNRAEARRALQSAASDSAAAMGSGADSGRMAVQGGGGGSMGHSSMSGHGSATMRDGGMGDSSMSRAGIILAQGGGGSGGLSGSTPGSPGTGTPGSTPRQMPGTAVQPPQTSAVPGAGSSTTGPGAPAPGSLTPAPGTTDAGPRTTTGSGGANPPRGTTSGQNR